MNNEIKEILARLSRYVITPDVRHDFDDLLNYITNLQSKIEAYELFDNQKIANLQEENERLNKGLEYMKIYWSNREEYEKNELLSQIRDKDTSIEWLERAIEEEKKRERLH